MPARSFDIAIRRIYPGPFLREHAVVTLAVMEVSWSTLDPLHERAFLDPIPQAFLMENLP
jgi:hypothetical protein